MSDNTKFEQQTQQDEQIILADIEELRAALGAEAELSAEVDTLGRSTIMCPAHPWDR